MTDQELCIKLAGIWKRKILELDLVDTGALLRSIKFSIKNNKVEMESMDYYKFLDEPYNITNSCIKSDEFGKLLERYFAEKIEKDLVKGL